MTTSKRGKKFRYGMRLRGFSIGCQPLDGFMSREEDKDGKYYDILTYNRRLTPEEVTEYELDDLNGKKRGKKRLTILREERNIKQADFADMIDTSVRTVQGWELNGMGGVSLDKCVMVATALGVTVNDLVEPEN